MGSDVAAERDEGRYIGWAGHKQSIILLLHASTLLINAVKANSTYGILRTVCSVAAYSAEQHFVHAHSRNVPGCRRQARYGSAKLKAGAGGLGLGAAKTAATAWQNVRWQVE